MIQPFKPCGVNEEVIAAPASGLQVALLIVGVDNIRLLPVVVEHLGFKIARQIHGLADLIKNHGFGHYLLQSLLAGNAIERLGCTKRCAWMQLISVMELLPHQPIDQ